VLREQVDAIGEMNAKVALQAYRRCARAEHAGLVQQSAVRHFLRQGVLEGVLDLGEQTVS